GRRALRGPSRRRAGRPEKAGRAPRRVLRRRVLPQVRRRAVRARGAGARVVSAAVQTGIAYGAADFADAAACTALAVRLAPFGIRLDAYELGLLVERLGRVPRWAELVI